MPETFEAQAELVWRHLERILAAAEMTFVNLVSIRGSGCEVWVC